jgi:hypothetical protein
MAEDLHAALLAEMRRQTEYLQRIQRQLSDLRQTLDGFTDQGASFRGSQVDPLVVAFASLIGPVLGDRLDGVVNQKANASKDFAEYERQFLRAAALLTRRALSVIDEYRGTQLPREAIEAAFNPESR